MPDKQAEHVVAWIDELEHNLECLMQYAVDVDRSGEYPMCCQRVAASVQEYLEDPLREIGEIAVQVRNLAARAGARQS
jgi:hypothetical protein